jgi:hypothetical protein
MEKSPVSQGLAFASWHVRPEKTQKRIIAVPLYKGDIYFKFKCLLMNLAYSRTAAVQKISVIWSTMDPAADLRQLAKLIGVEPCRAR